MFAVVHNRASLSVRSDKIMSRSRSLFLEILNLNKNVVHQSDLNVFSVMWQPGQELLSSHQFSKKLRAFFQMLDQRSDVVVHRLCVDLRKTETFQIVESRDKSPHVWNRPPRCPLLAAGPI